MGSAELPATRLQLGELHRVLAGLAVECDFTGPEQPGHIAAIITDDESIPGDVLTRFPNVQWLTDEVDLIIAYDPDENWLSVTLARYAKPARPENDHHEWNLMFSLPSDPPDLVIPTIAGWRRFAPIRPNAVKDAGLLVADRDSDKHTTRLRPPAGSPGTRKHPMPPLRRMEVGWLIDRIEDIHTVHLDQQLDVDLDAIPELDPKTQSRLRAVLSIATNPSAPLLECIVLGSPPGLGGAGPGDTNPSHA